MTSPVDGSGKLIVEGKTYDVKNWTYTYNPEINDSVFPVDLEAFHIATVTFEGVWYPREETPETSKEHAERHASLMESRERRPT